jgi:hypothetical protein
MVTLLLQWLEVLTYRTLHLFQWYVFIQNLSPLSCTHWLEPSSSCKYTTTITSPYCCHRVSSFTITIFLSNNTGISSSRDHYYEGLYMNKILILASYSSVAIMKYEIKCLQNTQSMSNDSIHWTISTEFQLETQVQIFGAQFLAYSSLFKDRAIFYLYATHIMIYKNIGI